MNIDHKTFCAAPWFQLRVAADGYFRSCCVIDHKSSKYPGQTEYNLADYSVEQWRDSDYNKYVKQNLTQGNRLQECQRCWQQEDNKQHSLRQITNDLVTNNSKDIGTSWLSAYFRKKQDWSSDLLLSVDIKISNLCNFACAMCHPMDSSQIYTIWKKHTTHPLVQMRLIKEPTYLDRARSVFVEKNNLQLLEDILDNHPTHLKILGGEPLMDARTKQTLGQVPNEIAEKINLLFVTNGSQDLMQARQEFLHYKSVSFVISLDGIGLVQDYIRRGSCWSEISKNIDNYIKCYGAKNIHVHHTLQALSVQGLIHLIKWCETRSICMSLALLDTPEYMSLASVPTSILQQVAAELENSSIIMPVPAYLDESHVSIMGLVDILQKQMFDSDSLTTLREFIQWYDPQCEYRSSIPNSDHWLGS
jgi:molybdenum cofactor biosynthesis enzyme MoaA